MAHHVCNTCNKVYQRYQALLTHVARNHSIPHRCKICNIDFLKKKYLEDHNYRKHPAKRHSCILCKARFNVST